MPTQAYKVWVIDKSMVQITSNLLFDEFSKTKLPDQAEVPVDPNPRDACNFTYLILGWCIGTTRISYCMFQYGLSYKGVISLFIAASTLKKMSSVRRSLDLYM